MLKKNPTAKQQTKSLYDNVEDDNVGECCCCIYLVHSKVCSLPHSSGTSLCYTNNKNRISTEKYIQGIKQQTHNKKNGKTNSCFSTKSLIFLWFALCVIVLK